MNLLISSRKSSSVISPIKRLFFGTLYQTSYLNKLYECSKNNKTPFFRIDSHHIRIIEDPLDFYLSLIPDQKGIRSSTYRIGLSCLYLGTGTLQRYLLRELKKRQQTFKDIDITMVFDYNRSLRQQKGESSVQMLYNWKDQLGASNVSVSFNKNSGKLGVLGEIIGVHHQKMAIFDDKIIVGGANMSQSYFLNRKDRYMQFNQCGQMANYLHEYLKTLSQNSYHIESFNKLVKTTDNLKQHYKLWEMAYRPDEFKQTLQEQQEYLDRIKREIQAQQARNIDIEEVKRKELQLVNRNEEIAKQIGTAIKVRQQVDEIRYKQKIDTVRQNLFGIGNEQFVGNELQLIANTYQKNDSLAQRGQKVYIFSFIHFPSMNITHEPNLFNQVLQIANKNGNNVRISSGYLNLTQKIINILSKKQSTSKPKTIDSKHTNSVQILCSAPQANSFYQGGTFKKYIPYFYRSFQIQLFKKYNQFNKFSIFQYNQNSTYLSYQLIDEWTFHSKGVWIKESENSYLTVLGSSNYNYRSLKGDTEMQLYLYSTCPKFNKRLDAEYQHMKEHCHQVDLEQLQNDPEIKCSWWIKLMSKVFKRFL